jgi:hypothetical protein
MNNDEMSALSNALALQAIQEIGQPIFTISAELDVAFPSTCCNWEDCARRPSELRLRFRIVLMRHAD